MTGAFGSLRPEPLRAAVCAFLATVLPLPAQGSASKPQGPPTAQQNKAAALEALEEQRILSVRMTGLEKLRDEVVLAELRTRAKARLRARAVRDDLAFLWSRFKLQCRVYVERNERGVHVRFDVVKEFFLFDRMSFVGLDAMSEREIRKRLGISEVERLTELTGASFARRLEDAYRQDGYPDVRVELRPDRKSSVLRFIVDEGAKCTVERVEILGNVSYKDGKAFLSSFAWNLIGSAGVKSKPNGFLPGMLSGEPYSQKTVREDLKRLRQFYRDQGYRDAQVELAYERFSPDRRTVEIGIRVVEGGRYRVGEIAVEVEGYPRGSKALFSPAEIRKMIEVREGAVYNKTQIDTDVLRIARFYGRKGFPSRDEHPRLESESAFSVESPVEVIDDENASVRLIYRVREGKRKKLRRIAIRGNDGTRDSVIRRELSVYPGEVLDSVELSVSQDRLLGLGYFGDRATGDAGVDFELAPVTTDPELVDLDITVREGSTGQILWGAGISSNNGPFANIQYRKSNFDWRDTPSGVSPFGWMRQIIDNEAFHGGGQTLNLDLSPGTEVSQASASFYEPDLFGTHLETFGLGLDIFRRLRIFESFDDDRWGYGIRVDRRFGRNVSVGFRFRDEQIKVSNIAPDAPFVIWAAEGRRRLRSIGVDASAQQLDRTVQPMSGYRVTGGAQLAPEWLDSEARFWKASARTTVFLPLYVDSRERAHVLTVRNSFGYGEAIHGQRELYLPERFFMGGIGILRGFRFRRTGPTQFGRPTGGEALYHGSLEYGFPIPGASTRLSRSLRETELVRGAAFVDWGFLGGSLSDPLFDQARITAGFGLQIRIPGLSPVPIALYFGWPVRSQATDRRQVFSFSFSSL